MENNCAICEDEIFASCHCEIVKETGHYYAISSFYEWPCPLDLNKPKEDSSMMPKRKIFFQRSWKNPKTTALYVFRKLQQRLSTNWKVKLLVYIGCQEILTKTYYTYPSCKLIKHVYYWLHNLTFDCLTFNKIFVVDYATINKALLLIARQCHWMFNKNSTRCLLLITRQCHWMLTFNEIIVRHSTALSDIQCWMSDNFSIDIL